MATEGKDLSSYDKSAIPNASNMRFGIVVSEWNEEITNGLLSGALDALLDCGALSENIKTIHVPGAFELPFGAQMLTKNDNYHAIICLGCVIRGETAHFDYVCQGAAQGIMNVSLEQNIPVIFGVLTDDNIEQSRARSGGSMGNKGTESAITAIKLAHIQNQLSANWGPGFSA